MGGDAGLLPEITREEAARATVSYRPGELLPRGPNLTVR